MKPQHPTTIGTTGACPAAMTPSTPFALRGAAWPALAAALACTMAWPAGAATPHPAEAVLHDFYARVLTQQPSSLPSADERQQWAAVLAPALLGLLQQASATEAACVASAPPDEKPLIVEGSVFTGNHEGATEVAYGELRPQGSRAHADVTLVHVDDRFAKAHRHRAHAWTDRVELHRIDGRWYVGDIRLSGKTTLTRLLKDYIAEASRSCKPR